jgi:hypothetical protein
MEGTRAAQRRAIAGPLSLPLGLALLAACVLGGASAVPRAAGQAQSGTAPAAPDFEGVFVRYDVLGGGSWDGANALIPRADLIEAPGAAAGRGGQAGGRGGRGVPAWVTGAGPKPLGGAGCGGGGLINIMQHSSAFHLVQTRDQVVLVGEMPFTRRIYMDGRRHPDMNLWDGSGAGHSIGRYEGNAMIVETKGFAGGGIPGGGRATRDTLLTERFEMTPDGKMLHVTMTWTDPAIYRKPHVYDFYYQKMPHDAYAFEEWCDMSDPDQHLAVGGVPGATPAAPAAPAAPAPAR